MFSDLSPQRGRAKEICSTKLAILPKKKYLQHGGKTRETHAPFRVRSFSSYALLRMHRL
jgi:hypothetical protein